MTPQQLDTLKSEFEFESIDGINRRTWLRIRKLLRGHARAHGCKRRDCEILAADVVESVKTGRLPWNRSTHPNILEFLFSVVRVQAMALAKSEPKPRPAVDMVRVRKLVAKMNANEIIANLPTIELLLSRLNTLMQTASSQATEGSVP